MLADLVLTPNIFWSFVLALTRVAGLWVFVPIPGGPATPEVVRVVSSVGLTIVLFPFWPHLPLSSPSIGQILSWMASEAAFGITAGLIMTVLAEAFTFGAQVLSLQAGFSYASTIDPTNHTDTGILALLVQLLAGFLFFSIGAERWLISALAESFHRIPAGAYTPEPATALAITRLFGQALTLGLRCALPVVSLLVLLDLALALASRVNAQLQLLSLAFPAKLALSFVALALAVSVIPDLYHSLSVSVTKELTSLAAGFAGRGR